MQNQQSTSPTRELAYNILTEYEKEEQKLDRLLNGALDKNVLMEGREKAQIRRLVYGIVERRITLDYIIGLYAKVKGGKIKPPIRRILRMGTYEILYMEGVPDAAACNEAVKLAQAHGFSGLKGFVNGVLRHIARDKAKITLPEDLSVKYSIPEWIVHKFTKDYGKERAERMCQSFAGERPLTLRITGSLNDEATYKQADGLTPLDKTKTADAAQRSNTATDITGAEQHLIQSWEAAGVEVSKSPWLPHVYYCKNVAGVPSLEGFREGKFTVQDISSMLAVYAAGIQAGDTVVDVCAAPGGKSCLAAELTGKEGKVYSFDVSMDKLDRIRENAERLNLHNIQPGMVDARLGDESIYGRADVVLADVPCSGLGVLGRKADIRYRLQEEDIESLSKLQQEILRCAVKYLKDGGTLVYSTCTITPEENRIPSLEGYRMEAADISLRLPKELQPYCRQGAIQIFPGEPEDMPALDGFYIAVVRVWQNG